MLKELVEANRSYRGYRQEAVPEKVLRELVDLARITASGVNRQSLKYQILWQEEPVKALNGLTHWAMALKDRDLPGEGRYPTAYIVVYDDLRISPVTDIVRTDLGIAAQTILLAAVEKGYGGCMLGAFDHEKVKAAMGITGDLEPILIIAVGQPDEEIILTDVGEDGNTTYYRDEEDRHYVPKRKLEDILV